MRVVVKFNVPEQYDKIICIDEDVVFIAQNNDKQIIETTYKDRFNTLLSLFVLKTDWKNEKEYNPLYEVIFENNSKEIYSFKDTPSNWIMFMGYLSKLVGDSL